MGHSHHDGAHTHGSDSSNVLDALAQLAAVIALAVVGIDVIMWALHILMIVATAIGFAVLAAAGGYGWLKWRQFQGRRYQRLMQAPPPYPLYLAGRVVPPQMTQTAALRPAGGDLHLHLPPGISSAEVEQIIRGRALPGGTERWP